MTKADFHQYFPEVAASSSYRDLGQYHYPMIPYKTFRFLVREEKTSGNGSVPDEKPESKA